MADFNHNSWPDNYQNNIDKPAIIKSAESLWVWPKTWKVIIDTKTWIATILIKWETQKETKELNETLKKQFIEKLKLIKNQEIKTAIENWTLKAIEIPWRERVAISLNWTNIDYILDINWEVIFNLKKFINTEMVWDIININLKDKYWISLENWKYMLKWKSIDIYNSLLLNWISEWVDIVLHFEKLLKEEL